MSDLSNNLIKRRDIGIAGVMIVLFQSYMGTQSDKKIDSRFDKLTEDIQSLKVEREQYFVRKVDIKPLEIKIDKLSDEVSSLKSFVKKDYEASLEIDDGIIGCALEKEYLTL